MAESLQLGRTLEKGSENIPDNYCEPCFELKDELNPVAGHCIDCSENLCQECFKNHLGPKPLRNHKLVDKSTKPQTQQKPQRSLKQDEICSVHGATIQSFCKFHFQLCCKVCHAINHKKCEVKEISKLAQNIHNSQELQTLTKKLKTIKKGFEESLRKTGHHEITIQKNFSNAINDMKKLKDEINKLLKETEKLAKSVKEEDFNKIEAVSSNCNIVTNQINNITSNLDKLKEKKEEVCLFISMKRAESQLKSLEEGLDTLANDNTVREYKFEPDKKVKAMMRELKALGQLMFSEQAKAQQVSRVKVATIPEQMAKKAVYVSDINTKSASDRNCEMYGMTLLSNSQILINDYQNLKVKQLDSKQGTLISELQLSGHPFDITKLKTDEVAVTVLNPNQIQLVSVTKHSLQKLKTIPVNGLCRGIVYNDIDQTFIVTFNSPSQVKIIDMSGTVLKTLERDSTGAQLFTNPYNISLSPDKTGIYISDNMKRDVTLVTLNGDIKTVYKDRWQQYPAGVCVHKSGVVYVVGLNTVHQIEPESGKFKLLLEQKDGLQNPWNISYCEVEDKLYVGMRYSPIVKVFKMQ